MMSRSEDFGKCLNCASGLAFLDPIFESNANIAINGVPTTDVLKKLEIGHSPLVFSIKLAIVIAANIKNPPKCVQMLSVSLCQEKTLRSVSFKDHSQR